MAYTGPRTWVAGETVTHTIMNTHIRDNLIALKDPPGDYIILNHGSDFTTTSTSWTDIDGGGTELTITITLDVESDVEIGFQGNFWFTSATNNVYLDVDRDGTALAGDDGILAARPPTTAPGDNISFKWIDEDVAAGSRTYKMRWKVGGSTANLACGAGTASADIHPFFYAKVRN